MATTTRTITIPPQLDPVAVLGPVDEVIREVERAFPDLTIIVRGNRVAIVSRSKQTEAQAAQAEDLVNTIIQAAYTAPMDADTVRRMLDQNVLKNHVRLEHPGHGPVRDKLAQSHLKRTRPCTFCRLPRPDVPQAHGSRRHHLCCRRAGPCENRRTSGLRERHRIAHHHLRHWPRRHRQDVSGRGQGCACLPGQADSPHHPHAPGRGGRRKPRLSARHAE